MNPAARLLPKFFVLCSVILILTGVAQYLVRPRQHGESRPQKVVNRSTITALLSDRGRRRWACCSAWAS